MKVVVVETEAYRGQRDPASHAFRGETPRTRVMFEEGGHAYVYFTMGMHYCLNVTAEGVGTAAAVLIRALQPEEGLGAMSGNRGVYDVRRLASGPGNLTKALGIDGRLNGEDMVESRRLFFESGNSPGDVVVTTRVGVTSGMTRKWRFYIKGNPFVSKGRPSLASQNP